MKDHTRALLAVCVAVSLGLMHRTVAFTQPVFRAGTTVVEVAAIVVDDGGAPIRDLTAGDFSVFENGEPRALVSFRKAEAAPAPKVTAVGGLDSGIVTNSHSSDAPVFVLLLDDLNISAYRTHRAIRGALGLLAAVPATALVGIVTSSGVGIATLNLAPPGPQHADQVKAMRGQQLTRGMRTTDPARASRRARVLESVARSLTRAGSRRKVLFWVTENMGMTPVNITEAQQAQRKAFEAVLAADVAVYPVHPDELPAVPEREGGAPISIGSPNIGATSMSTLADDYAAVTLDQLARESGGRWIVDINNHERVLADVVRQNSVSYVLAYETAAGETPRRRRIDVRVAREGARVYARRGYYVQPPLASGAVTPDVSAANTTLADLLASVVPHGTLGMRVSATPLVGRGKQGRAVVTIGIDTTGAGTVRVAMMTVSADGDVANHQVMQMPPPPANGPWEATIDMPLPRGEHQIRVAAVTADERLYGLVVAPIIIPKEPGGPWIGEPMVLSSRRLDGGIELRPTNGRTVAVGTVVVVHAQVITRKGRSSSTSGRVSLVDAKGVTTAEGEVRLEDAPRDAGLLLRAAISTDTLPPGRYDVHVEVSDGDTRVKAMRRVPIVVHAEGSIRSRGVLPQVP